MGQHRRTSSAAESTAHNGAHVEAIDVVEQLVHVHVVWAVQRNLTLVAADRSCVRVVRIEMLHKVVADDYTDME